MNLGLNFGNPAILAGPRYLAQAKALFARMTTPPTRARMNLINQMIGALLDAGVWQKLDALYVMAAADSQAARLNWIADQYNLTAVNSPTFTVDSGYTGNGTSSYLSTGMVASTLNASGKMKQNSLTMGAFVLSEVEILRAVVGSTSTGADALFLMPKYNPGGTPFVRGGAYSAGGDGTSSASTIEQFSISRTVGTEFYLRRAGAAVSTVTAASSSPTAANIEVLRGVGTYFPGEAGTAFFGEYLTQSEDLSLRNATISYLTGVGRLP